MRVGDVLYIRPFQSTLPVRGATRRRRGDGCGGFISIHAPREGSDHREKSYVSDSDTISIHAPREGSDTDWAVLPDSPLDISIHAPREGSDVD